MKKVLLLFVLFSCFFVACHKKTDVVVAEIYNHKLYLSQIDFPQDLSPVDSVKWLNSYIDDWLMNNILLQHAEKELSLEEKNFDKQIQNYKNSLLLEAYYQKIVKDKTIEISDKEIQYFLNQYSHNQTINREVVRINYVKLSKKSKISKNIKDILFNEEKRVSEKHTIERLCGDSIEYFIDDNTWLFLDYIESEFPFEIADKENLLSSNKNVEVTDDEYRYFVVFLDYKVSYATSNDVEETSIAKTLLRQQKMTEYLNSVKDSLFKEALRREQIIR